MELNPRDNYLDPAAATGMDSDNNGTDEAQGRAYEALRNVTALFYDQAHHRIYTGNLSGFIHVWST